MWYLPENIFDSNTYEVDTERAVKLGDLLMDKCDEFGLHLEIIENGITVAPQVIRFDCEAADGVSVRKLPQLKQDLQYEIGAQSLRILAPVPGRRAIGIEVDNPNRNLVTLGDFPSNIMQSPLTFPLGINSAGEKVFLNLPENGPHMLVAGITGGGKSTMIHSMISWLISHYTPDELTLIMVDTKMVELTRYNGIPHLGWPVVEDAREAATVFAGIVETMERRYAAASRVGARNLLELNEKSDKHYQHILVVVDELADLILSAKASVEDSIIRLAGKARAMGIHLVLATQSPRKDILTGIVKANLSSRLAFATGSELDSRIILDTGGAAQLLGCGDCLFSEQGRQPIRIQSPYVSSEEIDTLGDFWRSQNRELVAA